MKEILFLITEVALVGVYLCGMTGSLMAASYKVIRINDLHSVFLFWCC